MMDVKKIIAATTVVGLVTLIGCGLSPNVGEEQAGVTGNIDLTKVSGEVTNIMLVCGQGVEISDERKLEFEAGLTDILKQRISGSAKAGLIQKRTSGWQLEHPNYEAYLKCVTEQSNLAIKKLEFELEQKEAQLKLEEKEKWVANVALLRMNENLYRWQRFVEKDRWRQYDVSEVEQILNGLKKKLIAT